MSLRRGEQIEDDESTSSEGKSGRQDSNMSTDWADFGAASDFGATKFVM